MTFTEYLSGQKRDKAAERVLAHAMRAGTTWPTDAARLAPYLADVDRETDPAKRDDLESDLTSLWASFRNTSGDRTKPMSVFRRFFVEQWAGLSLMIIAVVIILLMALGVSSDEFLLRLEDTHFARGLVTYLFAVGIIGLFFIVAIGSLTAGEAGDEQFSRGKDLLALLIGIFGTILGFYFGSNGPDMPLRPVLKAVMVSPEQPTSGQTVRLTTAVEGGAPPYVYRIEWTTPDGKTEFTEQESKDGSLDYELRMPTTASDTTVPYEIEVTDAAGRRSTSSPGKIELRKAPQ